MTNALVGLYNIGVVWLSPKVKEQTAEYHRSKVVRHILDRTTGIGSQVVADRYNEKQFAFNHDSSWLPDVKYKYKKVGTFEEVCMDAAQILVDTGKTIDFHWSGGLDSTTALVALNEIAPKQLHIICNKYSIAEYPSYYDKIIKHLDHTVDVTDNVLGVGNPQKNIWTQGTEADTLFGGCLIKFDRTIRKMTTEEMIEAEEEFKLKFRYTMTVRGWRTLNSFDGDWLDLDNWIPFFTSANMQQYAINKIITGDMYWWSNFLFGENDMAYLNAKMDFRDFIYKYTNDKEYAYTKLKHGSIKPGQKSIRDLHLQPISIHMLPETYEAAIFMPADKRKKVLDSDIMPKAWGFTNTGIVINKRTCKDINIDDYLNPEWEYNNHLENYIHGC